MWNFGFVDCQAYNGEKKTGKDQCVPQWVENIVGGSTAKRSECPLQLLQL